MPVIVEYDDDDDDDDSGDGGDMFVRRAISSEIKHFNALVTELRDTCLRSIDSLNGERLARMSLIYTVYGQRY